MLGLKKWDDWEDRTVGLVLIVVAALVVVAIGVGTHVSDSDGKVVDGVLKCAGGVVVLLGAYFTARTLKQTRAEHRATRMIEAIKLAADPDPGLRRSGVLILRELATSCEDTPREKSQRALIHSVLGTLSARDERAPPSGSGGAPAPQQG